MLIELYAKKLRQLFVYCRRFLLLIASYLFFLFFRRSDQRFIARVMAMQIGKKGVNGPAQNTRQVDAMTDAHVQPNIADSRYPHHTGE